MVNSTKIALYGVLGGGGLTAMVGVASDTPDDLRLPLVLAGLVATYGAAAALYVVDEDQSLLTSEPKDERTVRIEAMSSRNTWTVEMVLLTSLPLVIVGTAVELPTDFTLLALALVGFAAFYGSKSWYERTM